MNIFDTRCTSFVVSFLLLTAFICCLSLISLFQPDLFSQLIVFSPQAQKSNEIWHFALLALPPSIPPLSIPCPQNYQNTGHPQRNSKRVCSLSAGPSRTRNCKRAARSQGYPRDPVPLAALECGSGRREGRERERERERELLLPSPAHHAHAPLSNMAGRFVGSADPPPRDKRQAWHGRPLETGGDRTHGPHIPLHSQGLEGHSDPDEGGD